MARRENDEFHSPVTSQNNFHFEFVMRTFEDPIFNEIKPWGTVQIRKARFFETGFFLFPSSSKKKFLFEENVAILQLK